MRLAPALLLILASRALAADAPVTFVAVDADGRLLVFSSGRAEAARRLEGSGCGDLIGIDRRPADGKLYGVTRGSDVVRIDPQSGACTLVSTLTVPFDGAERSGVDFTPQLDRLRLVSDAGQNVRVNVAMGATAVDTPLAFAGDDPHAGTRPHVTAAAYANNVAGVATTKLFEIDASLDALVLQDPANDGTLHTIGPLGLDFGPRGGFDIVTEHGVDRAFAVTGDRLLTIDLATGRATPIGTVGTGGLDLVGLAIVPEAAAP